MASKVLRPKILIRAGRQNQPIRVPIADLLIDPLAETFLTVDSGTSSASLTVKNVDGFTTGGPVRDGKNAVLIFGEIGNENSELVYTSGSTAPTGTTITLSGNPSYPHSAGTRIRLIPFDMLQILTGSTTVASSSAALASIGPLDSSGRMTILPDMLEQVINDTTTTSGYYFARWYNSKGTPVSSDYSDPAPVAGYTSLSARSLIDNALASINKKQSDVFSDEFGFMSINNCQIEVLKAKKRWSWMQKFNSILGQTTQGKWSIAVPTDLDDQNTNKSVWNMRIGKQPDMAWVDKEKWDELTAFVAHTTLNATLNVGDTSMTLVSSGDFDDSGTVTIGKYTYNYSANNRSSNVLTITAVPSGQNQSSGSDVFFGQSNGEPSWWTTYGGNIYLYPVPDSNFANRNVYMDYYSSLVTILLDSDLAVVPDATLIQYYLAWKYLVRMNNGNETTESKEQRGYFENALKQLVNKDVMGRTFKMRARINDFSQQMNFPDDQGKRIRDSSFPNI